MKHLIPNSNLHFANNSQTSSSFRQSSKSSKETCTTLSNSHHVISRIFYPENNGHETVCQLLRHVPDSIITFSHKKDMPAIKEFIGVVLFADISGFTALTEKYSSMATADGTSGTDKLSATLNEYIGKIVDEIIKSGGDVLKFAGDAILATWKCSDIGHNAQSILNKVIKCSIGIQEKCDSFMTEVEIVLRVKLAIAVGSMCLTYVGLQHAKHFDLSGTAVDDVGLTEKQATPGAIILSTLAWGNCDQTLFSIDPMESNKIMFYRVVGLAENKLHNETNQTANQIKKMLIKSGERHIITSYDHMIDTWPDFRQDMPLALMMDEDEKVHDYHRKMRKKTKKIKKFDRLTMQSLLIAKEVDNLRAYVPEPVLHKIDHGQDMDWLSEMRQVSVLFINMKLPDGSVKAAEALQKAFEVVYASCNKYKGNLNKVFGFDKGCTFVVIFGLPGQKNEDDPARALKCSHHIFDSLHAMQEIREESIGVTTGLAFCGVIGHKDRHEYTVIGSKVNMAARLMMYYPGILTCDADTYEAVKHSMRKSHFIQQPFIELKGMKDPGIVREYDPDSSKKDEEEKYEYPIIGREKEMEIIRKMLSATAHGESSRAVLIIQGEAGIGKTRVLEEAMTVADGLNVVHIEGDLPHKGSQFYVAGIILKALLDTNEALNVIQDLEAIITSLEEKSANIKGSDNESSETNKLTEIVGAILKLLEMQPTLFALDNCCHYDDSSWKVLKGISSSTTACFLYAVRPSTLQTTNFLSNPVYHKIVLEVMNELQVVDFICQLLEVDEIPRKLSEVVYTKSQGMFSWCEQLIKDFMYSNVLYILPKTLVCMRETIVQVESMRKMIETDTDFLHTKERICSQQYKEEDYIRASEGTIPFDCDEICVLEPEANLDKLLVPNNMKDMVLARLDRMSLSEQNILKCAAVLGQRFSRDLLRAIIPKNCINMLDTTLFNLCKQQFFECGSISILNQSRPDGGEIKGFGHHAQATMKTNIMCGCYAYEGYPGVNLSHADAFDDSKKRVCLYFQFSNTFVQESAYALWLEDQRRLLHEKAALYLEGTAEKCRGCGGSGFIPGHGKGVSVADQARSQRKHSLVHNTRREVSDGRIKSRVSQQLTGKKAIIDETLRIIKTSKLDHWKNYQPEGTKGEAYGLAMINMARTMAYNEDTNKGGLFKSWARAHKNNHGGATMDKLPTETLLTEFLKTAQLSGIEVRATAYRQSQLVTTVDVDLSNCQCAELRATTFSQLVQYWRAAGNAWKTFRYQLDSASAFLDVNKNSEALEMLQEVQYSIEAQQEKGCSDFIITDEEKAKIDILKGQALCNMDRLSEGISFLHNALRLLKIPAPNGVFSTYFRTLRATLVQALHQRMPGVFTEGVKRENAEMLIEQVRCLSNLSLAYTKQKDHARAYLANLEKLNLAEEAAEEYWNELMQAYTDMISSCQIYGRYEQGKKYEATGKEQIKSASLNVEGMQTSGNFYLASLSFNLSKGDVTAASAAGTLGYKVSQSINDVNLKMAIASKLSIINLYKHRVQSCVELLASLKDSIKILDEAKWIYYCCITSLLIDGGNDVIESVNSIIKFSNIHDGEHFEFYHYYIRNGLALWFARQGKWNEAKKFYDQPKELDLDNGHILFDFQSQFFRVEYLLHSLRVNKTSKQNVQTALHSLEHKSKGKRMFTPRFFHLKAYLLYLNGQTNRAKMYLEDCLLSSKDQDLIYDFEWATSSKTAWFGDMEQQTLSVKHALPRV